MLDLDELQRLAEGATPGPWFAADWGDDFGDNKTTIEARSMEVLIPGRFGIWPDGIAKHRVASTSEGDWPLPDAAFIAAMHPDTAKKLIAVARAGLVAHREIQRFKMRWLNLPPFAEKLNKTTREGMTMAHQPIMMAEEELRAALEELRSLPDPAATPQERQGE